MNDNQPLCMEPTVFELPEHSPIGTVVGVLSTNDPDSGRNGVVLLELLSHNDKFKLDSAFGKVRDSIVGRRTLSHRLKQEQVSIANQ